jgi:hypothetical protein
MVPANAALPFKMARDRRASTRNDFGRLDVEFLDVDHDARVNLDRFTERFDR